MILSLLRPKYQTKKFHFQRIVFTSDNPACTVSDWPSYTECSPPLPVDNHSSHTWDNLHANTCLELWAGSVPWWVCHTLHIPGAPGRCWGAIWTAGTLPDPSRPWTFDWLEQKRRMVDELIPRLTGPRTFVTTLRIYKISSNKRYLLVILPHLKVKNNELTKIFIFKK